MTIVSLQKLNGVEVRRYKTQVPNKPWRTDEAIQTKVLQISFGMIRDLRTRFKHITVGRPQRKVANVKFNEVGATGQQNTFERLIVHVARRYDLESYDHALFFNFWIRLILLGRNVLKIRYYTTGIVCSSWNFQGLNMQSQNFNILSESEKELVRVMIRQVDIFHGEVGVLN